MALGLQTKDEDFGSFVKRLNLPTPEKVKEEGTALLDKEKSERKPLEDKMQANIDKMFANAEALKDAKPPEAPKLKDLPAEPELKYEDPTKALGSLASVLATFGSLKTRAPFTSALNSGAAAMDAFHKGDVERVKLEREKWHDNMELGLKQNQIEMDKYHAALQASQFDIQKARPMFEAIAASNNHTSMLIAAQHGDYRAMSDILTGANQAQQKLVDMYLKDQEKRLQIANTAAIRQQTLEMQRERNAIARERMEATAAKNAEKAVAAGKPGERAVEIIDQMQGILEQKIGVAGMAGMVRRPLESIASVLGGSDAAPAHQYESLARELQNILRQTEEFRYKGRTLAKEVADRDVMVRGLKFGDTDGISFDQLQHLKNMLTGEGASYSGGGEGGGEVVLDGYRFPSQTALDAYKKAKEEK